MVIFVLMWQCSMVQYSAVQCNILSVQCSVIYIYIKHQPPVPRVAGLIPPGPCIVYCSFNCNEPAQCHFPFVNITSQCFCFRHSCFIYIHRLTDQAFFLLGEAIKFPRQNCLHSKFHHSIQHIEKFLAIFDGFLYSWGRTLDFSDFSDFSEFSELTCQSPQLGNTGKYTASKVGPTQKNPVLGQLYWAYCPVEDSGVAALKTHQEKHFDQKDIFLHCFKGIPLLGDGEQRVKF